MLFDFFLQTRRKWRRMWAVDLAIRGADDDRTPRERQVRVRGREAE
jgi:hypothetical protein